MHLIDLNCDMGESFGAYQMGNDEEILNYVSSANIACGFHAGDPTTMRKTVKLAIEKNVGIGVHPGFNDLAGFGRRNIELTPSEVYDLIVYQIGALSSFAASEGGSLQHVKPHGALYNMASVNHEFSEAIAEAVYKVDGNLILFGLAGSELIKAGNRIGLKTANEVFSDRTYQENGTLTSRRERGAIIDNHETAVSQVIRMVKESKVTALSGKDILINADTICIHGDGAHALEFAKYISGALKDAGIKIRKISGHIDS
ncbi:MULTISPECIES: LamB/YcsF family protein [Bacillaceae]|uniref:LamB/YcsF family protein n=1 Tax=Bacillaceae TaxID=186817 RepID=UPI000C7708C9|nr:MULTISPECIES: 5-oxoprolinase subunit PxpA [Bacillaceae]PLR68669.1 lactam utilization protein LamB [Bacillus sp. UMB0893]QNG58555.1 LamB/YcsF family protein [Bacillus sp. PAMC26568]